MLNPDPDPNPNPNPKTTSHDPTPIIDYTPSDARFDKELRNV